MVDYTQCGKPPVPRRDGRARQHRRMGERDHELAVFAFKLSHQLGVNRLVDAGQIAGLCLASQRSRG